MLSMEPQDFGGLYHALWEQIVQGDYDSCRAIVKAMQVLMESEQETVRLGAKVMLDDLSKKIHEKIQTQDLEVLGNLERFEYEELLNMLDTLEGKSL